MSKLNIDHLKYWVFGIIALLAISCEKDDYNRELPIISFFNEANGTKDNIYYQDEPIQFYNYSLHGTQYTWNFDDGSSVVNEKEPSHVFTAEGKYGVSLTVSDGTDETKYIDTITIIVKPIIPEAEFLAMDETTSGNWIGIYGVDGYHMVNYGELLPEGVTLMWNEDYSKSWTWENNSTQERSLQYPDGSSRIAACRYSEKWGNGFKEPHSFTLDVGDQKTNVAVYFLDFDGGVSTNIELINTMDNEVLCSETVSNYEQGKYLNFSIVGKVIFRFSPNGGGSATMSGVFLDFQ